VMHFGDTNFVGKKISKFDPVERRYYGGDLQFYQDIPYIGGISLRGEYIQGTQPSTVSNTGSPKSDIANSGKWYVRDFSGYYGMLVQNIDPIRSQLVLKYDLYDPNTGITADRITKANKLDIAELQYATFGAGLVYHWNENVKFMLYYDHPMNETVDAVSLGHDPVYRYYTQDLKDDVLTFRIQYKF